MTCCAPTTPKVSLRCAWSIGDPMRTPTWNSAKTSTTRSKVYTKCKRCGCDIELSQSTVMQLSQDMRERRGVRRVEASCDCSSPDLT